MPTQFQCPKCGNIFCRDGWCPECGCPLVPILTAETYWDIPLDVNPNEDNNK